LFRGLPVRGCAPQTPEPDLSRWSRVRVGLRMVAVAALAVEVVG
jgi:hypothetical protein